MDNRVTVLLRLGVCAAALTFPFAGHAQVRDDEPAQAAAVTGTVTGPAARQAEASMNEITVVARRKEESLQEVPTSIGVLPTEDIQARAISGVQDIKGAVANLSTVRSPTPGGGEIAIRGIAANSTPNIAVDSQVGIYLDGVYLGRAQSSGGDISDIERLEVYRGPQGTVFGKNSTGGAINFITASPTGVLGAEATVATGNYDRVLTRVAVNSPDFAGFSFRVSYQHEEYDGDVKNSFSMPPYTYDRGFGRVNVQDAYGARNSDAVVAKARYEGIDGLTVNYKYDYSKTQEVPPVIQVMGYMSNDYAAYGAYLATQPGSLAPSSFRRRGSVPQDGAGLATLEAQGHMLNLNYELNDNLSINSISAYRTLKSRGPVDLDGSVLFSGPPDNVQLAGLHSVNIIDQKQWSQELQLIGEYDQFDFLLGLFYFHEKAQQDQLQGSIPLVPGPNGLIEVPNRAINQNDETNNKAYAIYGSVNYKITPELELAVGGRYTWDRKRTLDFRFATPVGGPFKDEQFTYDASLTYALTSDINVYAKYAKGYNAGGVARGVTFGAEKTQSYEGGIKSDLLNGALRINAAGFYSKTENLQTSQFAPGVGVVYFNVGKLETKGFEFELTARPTSGLTLTANYGFVDADFSNGDTLFVPDQNLTLAATYETPPIFGSAFLSLRVDADYRSDYRSSGTNNIADRVIPAATATNDLNNNGVPDAAELPASVIGNYPDQFAYNEALQKALIGGDYWLVNARLSLMDIPVSTGNLRLTAYVRNLFDVDDLAYPIDYGLFAGGNFERPRTYGLELGFKF